MASRTMQISADQPARKPTAPVPVDLRPEIGHICAVDWRWRRAEWRLRTGSRRSERKDDDWIRQGVKAQRWIQRGKPDKYPDIVAAEKLVWQDRWKRAELEARILANQPIRDISSTMGLPEGVISAFESLFFDVRRRLHAEVWVRYSVLGTKPFEPLRRNDVEHVWRTLGYLFDCTIVDQLVRAADAEVMGSTGLPAYWSKSSTLPKGLQLLLITMSLPYFDENVQASDNRFMRAGLCEPMPRFAAPPKDGTLRMAGEFSWGEIGSWMKVQTEEPTDFIHLIRAA